MKELLKQSITFLLGCVLGALILAVSCHKQQSYESFPKEYYELHKQATGKYI